MTNQIFILDNKKYQVYNTTQDMLHCVTLKSNGEKSSPNAKTLRAFTTQFFFKALEIGLIKIAN